MVQCRIHCRRRAFLTLGLFAVAGCGKPQAPALPPLPKASEPAPVTAAAPTVEPKPEPALDAAALLFPRHAGDSWEMDAKSGDTTYRFTLTTIATQDSSAGKAISYIDMQRDGIAVQREGYTADENGVYRVAFGPGGSGKIDPPMPMLKLPLQDGGSWDWKGTFQSPDGNTVGDCKFKLTGPELVKTPGGSFQAYRVDQTMVLTTPDGKQTTKNAQWFAPKVGLVKQLTDDGETITDAQLTHYAVGKEPPTAGAPVTTPPGH